MTQAELARSVEAEDQAAAAQTTDGDANEGAPANDSKDSESQPNQDDGSASQNNES